MECIRIKVLLITVFSVFAFSVYGEDNSKTRAQQGLPSVRHFDKYVHGFANENWAIAQSPNGFMYFGNGYGLLEYDGVNWKGYNTKTFSEVRAIAIDKTGCIYVGTPKEFGFFKSDEYGTLVYTCLSEKFNIQDCGIIWNIINYDDAIYFISYQNRIFKYCNNTVTELRLPKYFKRFKGYLVNNNFYLFSADAGLAKVVNDKLYRYHTELFETPVKVLTLVPGGKNKIIIGSRGENLYVIDISKHQLIDYGKTNINIMPIVPFGKIKNPQTGTYYYTPLNKTSYNLLVKNDIYHGYSISHGVNSFSTLKGGVFLIDTLGNLINHLYKERGLIDDDVLCTFEDSELNMWVATEKTTTLVNKNSEVRIFNEETGIYGSIMSHLHIGNNLYVGTTKGLYLIEKIKPNATDFKIPKLTKDNYYIKELIEYKDNTKTGIIFATFNGIYYYDFTTTAIKELFQHNSIFSVMKPPNDNHSLFISQPNGITIIRKNPNDKTLKYKHVTNILEDIHDISEMQFDKNGRLYISTYYSGLHIITFKEENNYEIFDDVKYNIENGLPRNDKNMWFLLEDTVVVATCYGIYTPNSQNMLGNSKLQFIPVADININLKSNDMSVTSILSHENELVLGTERGLLFLDAKTKKLKKDFSNKINKEGVLMLSNDSEGRLFAILNNNAMVLIDKKLISDIKRKPQLYFRKIYIGGDTIPIGKTNIKVEDIPFKKNSISVNVAYPHFSTFENTVYNFELIKDNELWQKQTDANSEFVFRFLPAGKYTLIAKALSNNEESDEIRLNFTILPPWYLVWYTWTVGFMLLGLFIYLLVRYLMKKYIASKTMFEKTIYETVDMYQTITANSNEMLFIIDMKTYRFTFVGGASYAMLGYKNEEFLQLTISDVVTPETSKTITELIEKQLYTLLKTGITQGSLFEMQQYHKNGELVWVEISASIIKVGKNKYQIAGNIRSIQERKNAEAAIREAENKYRLISENISDTVWVLDLQSMKFLFFSNSTYEMFGYTPEENMKLTLEEIVVPEHLELVYSYMKANIASYNRTKILVIDRFEIKLNRKNKSPVWTECSVRAIEDEDGSFHCVGVTSIIEERKQLEDALIESGRKYRLISENVKDALWVADLNTNKYTFVSGACFEIYGVTPEEFLENNIQSILTQQGEQESIALIEEYSKKYYETGIIQSYKHETQICRKNDNTLIWIEANIKLIPDEEEKELIQMVGVTRNIDERKKIETELIISENQYRFISENVADMIWVLDLKTLRYSYFSNSCYEIFGFTPNELLQMPIDEIIDPDFVNYIYEVINTNIAMFTQFGYMPSDKVEMKQNRKNKPSIWVECTIRGITDDTGNLVQFIGITRDINERKELETALKESEKKYKVVSDNTMDIFWIADINTLQYTFMSGAALETYGYTNDEFLNKKISDFCPPNALLETQALLEENSNIFYNTGTIQHYRHETQLYRKNGSLVWVEITIQLVPDENGVLTQMVGVSRQIEERKKAEQLLLKQKNELEAQQRKIKDSLAYASQIQKLLLLPVTQLSKVFPEHFVFSKPKDLVSGDFYWCNVFENYKIVVVADCTGHGVPAAFMSIICVRYLREITERHCYMPDEILNNLREKIMASMQQTEGMDSESHDSTDAAVVTIDLSTKIIYYSGANSNIYVMNNEKLTKYQADIMPVGVYFRNEPFSLTTINISDQCNIYMLTDGYVDQFNKKNRKKFTPVRLENCLRKIHNYPMKQQAKFLEKYIDLWKQNNKQIDDMLVVGFNVNSGLSNNTHILERDYILFNPVKRYRKASI